MKFSALRLTIILAVTGMLLHTALVTLAIRGYDASQKRSFDFTRNVASALGSSRNKVSPWAYNGALILCCPMYIPLVFALGRQLQTRIGSAAAASGSASLLAAAAIGFFPMDHRTASHFSLSAVFFLGWTLTVLLFTMAFWRGNSPSASPLMAWTGAISFALSFLFLAVITSAILSLLHVGLLPHPLRVGRSTGVAPAEWAVMLSAGIWIWAGCFYLWRSATSPRLS